MFPTNNGGQCPPYKLLSNTEYIVGGASCPGRIPIPDCPMFPTINGGQCPPYKLLSNTEYIVGGASCPDRNLFMDFIIAQVGYVFNEFIEKIVVE